MDHKSEADHKDILPYPVDFARGEFVVIGVFSFDAVEFGIHDLLTSATTSSSINASSELEIDWVLYGVTASKGFVLSCLRKVLSLRIFFLIPRKLYYQEKS